jgi:hypothetical protein
MQLHAPRTFGLGAAGEGAPDHQNLPGQPGLLLDVTRRHAWLVALVVLAGTTLAPVLGLRAPATGQAIAAPGGRVLARAAVPDHPSNRA